VYVPELFDIVPEVVSSMPEESHLSKLTFAKTSPKSYTLRCVSTDSLGIPAALGWGCCQIGRISTVNQGLWLKSWLWKPMATCLTGGAILATATAAQADPPGIYYSWRAMATDVNQCLNQAENALESQNLTPVQTDAISMAGQSEDTTAVFVCMDSPGEVTATTVMVIVSSADNDQAIALREALKLAF
jgi:hypothetical protein